MAFGLSRCGSWVNCAHGNHLLLNSMFFEPLLRHFGNSRTLLGVCNEKKNPGLVLLLTFIALAQVTLMEQLRYCAPGEWGKVLGLDRIPDVRTLRKKLALFSEQEHSAPWSAKVCADWMGRDPDRASVLDVAGHLCHAPPRLGLC